MENWKQIDVSSNFFYSHPRTISLGDLEMGKNSPGHRLNSLDLSLQCIDIQSELEPLRCSPVILESVYGSGSNSEAEDEGDSHIHYGDDNSNTHQDDMHRPPFW